MKLKFSPFVVSFFVFFVMLLFVLIAGYNIENLGLYYDEVLFVNAALGANSDIFIYKKLGNFPIMLMPYIGALKAYLYFPIFKIFGVSPESVRYPMIILGSITLFINYLVVKEAFSRTTAILFLFLAAFVPSVIFHTRLDWGPVTIMMFCRGLLLLFTFKWIKNPDSKYLYYILIIAFIGIFDKLNFIWLSISLIFSLLIVYPKKIYEFIKTKTTHAFILFVLSSSLGLILLIYIKKSLPIDQEVASIQLQTKWLQFKNLLFGMFWGTAIYGWIIGNFDASIFTYRVYSISALLIVTLISLFSKWKVIIQNKFLKNQLFLIIFEVITAFQIFITKSATGSHHIETLDPVWLMIVASILSLYFVNINMNLKSLSFQIIIVILVVSMYVYSNLRINLMYLTGFSNKIQNANWDPVSYKLVEILKAMPNKDKFITVDWGDGTVIYSLFNGKKEVIDLWPSFKDNNEGAILHILKSSLLERVIFIVRAEGKTNFSETRKNFLILNSKYNLNLKKTHIVYNLFKEPIYELYEFNEKFSFYEKSF